MIRVPSSILLLIVLYFALLEMNVPLLLADIRRLVMEAVIPLENVQFLIPRPVLKVIEKKKLDHLFMGRAWSHPSVRTLQRLSLAMARQLAVQARLFIRPLNLPGLVDRLVRELSLPRTFAALKISLMTLLF